MKILPLLKSSIRSLRTRRCLINNFCAFIVKAKVIVLLTVHIATMFHMLNRFKGVASIRISIEKITKGAEQLHSKVPQ